MAKTFDELKAKYPKVDPFLLKKWDRLFGIFFDRNASHDLTNADFFVVLRQARNIYGASSEQAKFARTAMTKLWEGLQKTCDENHDEKISIEEWVNVLSDKAKDQSWFNDYQEFMFKLFDVSQDNVLDSAEYADGMHCYGYEDAEAHAAFNAFAGQEKGKLVTIDKKQFNTLWHDYFFSTDKAAKGNALFGILPADF